MEKSSLPNLKNVLDNSTLSEKTKESSSLNYLDVQPNNIETITENFQSERATLENKNKLAATDVILEMYEGIFPNSERVESSSNNAPKRESISKSRVGIIKDSKNVSKKVKDEKDKGKTKGKFN